MSHCKKLFLLAALFLIPASLLAQSETDAEELFNQAEEIYHEGNFEQSRKMFEKASNILCANQGQTQICIESKIHLSNINRVNRNFQTSEELLEEAEQISHQRLGNSHLFQVKINAQKVFLYVDLTDFERARQVVNKTLNMVNDPELAGLPRARAFMVKAYLDEAIGDYNESEGAYLKAIELLEELERDEEVLRFLSHSYNNMGLLTRNLGDTQGAMEYFMEALEVTRAVDGENHPQVGVLYNSIGSIYYFMGDYGQAVDYFLSTADIFRENYGENHERVAGAYNNAGVVYTEMGEIERAAQILERAQRIKENLLGENHIDTAIGYSNLASIYMENENYNAALENYQKSIAVREGIYGGNHPNLITPNINIGEFYTRAKQYNTAREYFSKAKQITEDRIGQNHPNIWDILLNVGNTYQEERDFAAALEKYEKSYEMIVEENGIDPQQEFDVGQLSHPLLFMNTVTKIGDIHIKLYEAEGGVSHLHTAIENYSASIEVVDFLQKSYHSEASKLNLVDQNYSIFTNKIKAYNYLFEETGKESWLDEILATSELSRSRIALELLQDIEAKNFSGVPQEVIDRESSINTDIANFYQELNAEQEKGFEADQDIIAAYRDSLFGSRQELNHLTQQLENDFPEYYRLKYDEGYANRETLENLLEPDEALVNYIVSDEEVFALVLNHEKIQFHSLGSSDSLSSQIKSLRSSVLSDSSAQYSELAYTLYSLLMEPLLADLDSESLIIVPDQSLHYLPFEMLLTETNSASDDDSFRYLIQDYKISYVPSGTVFQTLSQQKMSDPKNLFAVAPFNESTLQVEEEVAASRYITDLSPLPLTRYETDEIAKIFDEAQSLGEYIFPEKIEILLGKQATKSTIQNTPFQDYGFIHFATHAFVNEEDPALSGIAFWGDEGEDGVMYVNDIYNMEMNADLVVLGACETGLGTVYKGEGMIGFTRAFTYAGASNLMVSMWKVNDQPTANLMIQFYKNVKDGHSYSESLQMAKVELINQPQFAAPRHWAAFVLQGR